MKTNSLLALAAVIVIVGGMSLAVVMDLPIGRNKIDSDADNIEVIADRVDETETDLDDQIEDLLSII